MSNLLSRKFIVTMAVIVSATGLCVGGYIHEGVYSAVVIAVVGGYLAANVAQKVGTKP